MVKKQVYWGTVNTGRGAAAGVMLETGLLECFQQLSGLPVIPGTLNIYLDRPFDLSLLGYASFADMGVPEIDLRALGLDFDGEQGAHYERVTIAGKYPGCLVFLTWVTDLTGDAELVSPHHLRSTLGLQDGDPIEFTLD